MFARGTVGRKLLIEVGFNVSLGLVCGTITTLMRRA